jgi:hypothetical protein
MFQVLDNDRHSTYFATEYLATNGPFESPQNFSRINLMGKYLGSISPSDQLGVGLSYFTSKWDASGQIPQRAVDDGTITRFGAIDDTEGGYTDRMNILVDYNKTIDDNSFVTNKIYYSLYNFELYSNFTFFLEDPVNGDQIRQKENRSIAGINSTYHRNFSGSDLEGDWNAGISLRNDQSMNNELSHTVSRSETLQRLQFGNIYETNLSAFASGTLNLGKWTFNAGLRIDYFNFQYNDLLSENYETQTNKKSILSPKLNILLNASEHLQLYGKVGKGFHTNDTRVIISDDDRQILPAAYGADLGLIWKPTPRLLFNTALWYLFLEQEFVYVGDAGIVEPSGKSQRLGVDLSVRYQPIDWLLFNLDANYAHARAVNQPSGQDYIPLAPDLTIVGGVKGRHHSGVYGGMNLRHINDRPANEDNSIVAIGYSIIDFNVGYEIGPFDLGIQVQNLLDSEWNETQFATESRLQDELYPVEEIHFTPGTPFFMKAILVFKF